MNQTLHFKSTILKINEIPLSMDLIQILYIHRHIWLSWITIINFSLNLQTENIRKKSEKCHSVKVKINA